MVVAVVYTPAKELQKRRRAVDPKEGEGRNSSASSSFAVVVVVVAVR